MHYLDPTCSCPFPGPQEGADPVWLVSMSGIVPSVTVLGGCYGMSCFIHGPVEVQVDAQV
jgi:hypothetical protein